MINLTTEIMNGLYEWWYSWYKSLWALQEYSEAFEGVMPNTGANPRSSGVQTEQRSPRGDDRPVPAGKIRAGESEAGHMTGSRLCISVQHLGSPIHSHHLQLFSITAVTNTDTLYARPTTTSLMSSQQLRGQRERHFWCFLRIRVTMIHVWESAHLRTEGN